MILEALEGKARTAVNPPAAAKAIAYDGAIRSGKTIGSILLAATILAHGAPGKAVIVGKTIDSIIENVIDPMVEIFGPDRVSLNRGLRQVTLMGRVVKLFGANDLKATSKIQGMTLAFAYVDEASNVPEAFFNMLWSRLSVPGARMILTCNPDGPRHWLRVKWLGRARWTINADGALADRSDDPDTLPWFRVVFRLDDNAYLVRHNPSYIADLKASFKGQDMWYRRYILGEWVSAEGAVYDMLDITEGHHVIPPGKRPRISEMLMAAVDYGTTHRTRAYLLGLAYVTMGQDGWPQWDHAGGDTPILVVAAEYAPGTATVGVHASGMIQWLEANSAAGRPKWVAVDPAAAVMRRELYAQGLDHVMAAHNSVLPGIQTVAALLGTHRLFIDSSCAQLIRGLPGYMWDIKATERGETRPIKENDDEADALRYVVYTSRRYWTRAVPLAPLTGTNMERPDDEH